MSRFTDLLDNPFATHRYLFIGDPLDPATAVSGTDISVTGGNSFASVSNAFGGFAVGDVIVTVGSDAAANNSTFTVSAASAGSITVTGGGLTNAAAGGSIGIIKRRRVYLSSGRFITGATVTPPAGAPQLDPHIAFEARLDEALHFSRSMYQGGAIGGASIPSLGQVKALNTDGEFDDWKDLIWDLRPCWVLLGGDGFDYSEYGTVFAGLTSAASVDQDTLTIEMTDYKALLDTPIQRRTFKGTGGIEGGVDLLDKPWPLAYGWLWNIEPVYVGVIDGLMSYVFHDGAVAAYDATHHALRESGVLYTYTAGRPSAGQWTFNATNSLVQIGGTPTNGGLITMDTKGEAGTGGFVGAVGPIIRRIVTTRPGDQPILRDPTDLDTASFTAFDVLPLGVTTLGAVRVGDFVREGDTIINRLNLLVNSVGGLFGFRRQGLFNIARFDAPGTPVQELVRDEILDLKREASAPPLRELTLGYRPIWRKHSQAELANSVRDNVVVNGDFSSATGWTQGSGWTISGGLANASAVSADLSRSITLVAGLEYILTLDVTRAAGSVQPKVGSTLLGSAIAASGAIRVVFTAGSQTTAVLTGSGFTGSVDNFSIRPSIGEFLTNEFRTVKSSDGSVFSRAADRVNTLLADQIDALAEAAREHALRKVQRDIFTATTKSRPFAVDVADTTRLTTDRWGLAAGKTFVNLTIDEDAWLNQLVSVLWG